MIRLESQSDSRQEEWKMIVVWKIFELLFCLCSGTFFVVLLFAANNHTEKLIAALVVFLWVALVV